MKLRINKLISDAGLGSRRDVEEYIRQGRVKINGRRAQLSDLVSETDIVFFDEVDLPVKELLQEHAAEEKLQSKLKKDSERPRSKDRRSERAESQRLQAAPKSAALRKTSKNNPENKRQHQARLSGWGEEEDTFDASYGITIAVVVAVLAPSALSNALRVASAPTMTKTNVLPPADESLYRTPHLRPLGRQ